MVLLLPLFLYTLMAAANPIKRARDTLSENKGLTQKDYLVTHLPGLAENIPEPEVPLMFAGQLPLYHENNTHYFFWKFVDRQKDVRAQNRTIFWLNGGPGCSSMDGALMEAGPFRVNSDKEVTYNNGSWHRQGDIVFVDQPAGTGFSYSMDFDAELADVSWHFLTFLERYFQLFPEDLTNEILLAGESYAGQYIPYIADAVIARNQRIETDETSEAAKYNLRGLLIGNGYISPNEQGLSFVPFAVGAGLIDTNHPHWNDLLHAHENCQKAVDRTKNSDGTSNIGEFSIVDRTCDNVLNLLLEYTADVSAPEYAQCTNMYDYTLKDAYPSCGMSWPPDLAYVTPFLAKEAVMSDLNLVFHKHWTECSGSVGSHLKARKSVPSVELLPSLLEHVEIVLFHGNRDIICNYMGAESLIKKLEWGGKRGFSDDIVTYDWNHNGTVEGYVRSERNLTFVNVFDASHMVPFDKPEVSRAIVDLLYKNYDTRAEEGKKPELLTYPIGYIKPSEADTTVLEESGVPEQNDSTETAATETTATETAATTSNSTSPIESGAADSQQNNTQQTPTNGIVRVIQLAVIVVLIWGVCALYSTYKAKPTSIIKTKHTGRKKNVSWADQLESAVKEPAKASSLIGKAFSKLTKPTDTLGGYQHVQNEDIEMNEGVQVGDDFIIASDDEDDNDESAGSR